VTTLKVDRSFVLSMGQRERDLMIVKSTVQEVVGDLVEL